MPLSEPVAREEYHTRKLDMKAYRRDDGLWDIEAHMTDTKPFESGPRDDRWPAGRPIHDMWLRLTIDESYAVRACEAWTARGPYPDCPRINAAFAGLAGLSIGPGWNRAVRERLGGARGCTHLVEMLAQMATTAYQALWSERDPEEAEQPPPESMINSCYAYREDGPLAAKHWPALFPPRDAADAAE